MSGHRLLAKGATADTTERAAGCPTSIRNPSSYRPNCNQPTKQSSNPPAGTCCGRLQQQPNQLIKRSCNPPAGICCGRTAAAWARGGAAGRARRARRPAPPRRPARRRPARRARRPAGSGSPAGGWQPGSRGGRVRCPAGLPNRRCPQQQRCPRQRAGRRRRRRQCRLLAAGCRRRAGVRNLPPGAAPAGAGAGAAAAAPRRPLQPRHRSRRGLAAHATVRLGPCRPCRRARHAPGACQPMPSLRAALLRLRALRRRRSRLRHEVRHR